MKNYKTGINLWFSFNTRRKLSVIRCNTCFFSMAENYFLYSGYLMVLKPYWKKTFTTTERNYSCVHLYLQNICNLNVAKFCIKRFCNLLRSWNHCWTRADIIYKCIPTFFLFCCNFYSFAHNFYRKKLNIIS